MEKLTRNQMKGIKGGIDQQNVCPEYVCNCDCEDEEWVVETCDPSYLPEAVNDMCGGGGWCVPM